MQETVIIQSKSAANVENGVRFRLARKQFREGPEKVAACTKGTCECVYIVVGSRNAVINQRCVNQPGLPVYACDMECSSVENAVSQLAWHFHHLKYEDLGKVIARSLKTSVYYPAGKGRE